MHLECLESTQELTCRVALGSRLSPRATLTHLSCSPNLPRTPHAKHEPILTLLVKLCSYVFGNNAVRSFLELASGTIHSFGRAPCLSHVRDWSSVCGVFYLRAQLHLENTAICYDDRRVSEHYVFHLNQKVVVNFSSFLCLFFLFFSGCLINRPQLKTGSFKATVKYLFCLPRAQ